MPPRHKIYLAASSPVFTVVLLMSPIWEQFVATVPYGVKYSVAAIGGSVAYSLMNPQGTVRGYIRRMCLSVILSAGVAWVLTTYFNAGVNLCISASGLIGFTIDRSAPWLHFKAEEVMKQIFNRGKNG